MVDRCIFCKSNQVVQNGKRKRKIRIKQSYLCRKCGKQFVDPDGFERMRHDPKIIARAIHMYNDGFSLFNVQNHLWQHDGVLVTLWTISKWHKKYSLFLKSGASIGKTDFERETTLR